MYCFGLWNKCLVLSFNCFTCWLIWVWKIWVFNSFKVLPHSTFDCKQLIENCLKLNWNERSWSLNLTFYDILVSSRYYYYPKVGMYTIQGGKKKKKRYQFCHGIFSNQNPTWFSVVELFFIIHVLGLNLFLLC